MKHLVLLLIVALLAACASKTTGPECGGFTNQAELIADRVESISPDRLMGRVADFASIHSRYMHYDEGCAEALNMLAGWLEEQGNVAEWDSFTHFRLREIRTASLYVDFPGSVTPERQVLVGAHWDSSVGNDHWWYDEFGIAHHDSSPRCPGAVDNATGVAALLELTRILRDTPTAYSVRVVFFAGEELGFWGSNRFMEFWDEETGPDSLVCMVNVDMVGWDGEGEADLRLLCHESTVPMAVDLLPLTAKLIRPVLLDTFQIEELADSPGSDHYPFWRKDLPAIFLWEGPEDSYPNANSTLDTLGAVMPGILEAGARALTATVLQLAKAQLPES